MTPDAWFRTGDVAIMDKENYIYIVDRAKQIIIRGGENISCAEVEAAIIHNPAVMEVCVFGLPDERLGEKVAAMVLLKPGAKLSSQAPPTYSLLFNYYYLFFLLLLLLLL